MRTRCANSRGTVACNYETLALVFSDKQAEKRRLEVSQLERYLVLAKFRKQLIENLF
jgi:hypothetical protein